MTEVVFLWVGFDDYPARMVRSVREHLPGAKLVQMTDERSRIFDVDEVRRKPWCGHLMQFRMWHLADWPHTQGIVLDGDVVVRGDLTHVFEQDFDVALTKRTREDYPYNAGVMFSRCPAFWLAAWRWLKHHTALWDWDGDQAALKALAPDWNVLELPCSKYNWTPASQNDRSDALVYHYKGKRKEWLRADIVRGL